MSWIQANGFARARMQVMRYINGVVASGEPFLIKKACIDMGRRHDNVGSHLRALQADGFLTVEVENCPSGIRYRITLPDGRSTPWPPSFEGHAVKPSMAEVQRMRQELEQSRAAHREFWLSQERAPRRRAQPRSDDFMDKATVLALQGISA